MAKQNDPDIFSTSPAQDAVVIGPSDTVALTQSVRAIYVGTAGDLQITTVGGSQVVFKACPAGFLLPVACKQVWASLTTASNLVGLM